MDAESLVSGVVVLTLQSETRLLVVKSACSVDVSMRPLPVFGLAHCLHRR